MKKPKLTPTIVAVLAGTLLTPEAKASIPPDPNLEELYQNPFGAPEVAIGQGGQQDLPPEITNTLYDIWERYQKASELTLQCQSSEEDDYLEISTQTNTISFRSDCDVAPVPEFIGNYTDLTSIFETIQNQTKESCNLVLFRGQAVYVLPGICETSGSAGMQAGYSSSYEIIEEEVFDSQLPEDFEKYCDTLHSDEDIATACEELPLRGTIHPTNPWSDIIDKKQ